MENLTSSKTLTNNLKLDSPDLKTNFERLEKDLKLNWEKKKS